MANPRFFELANFLRLYSIFKSKVDVLLISNFLNGFIMAIVTRSNSSLIWTTAFSIDKMRLNGFTIKEVKIEFTGKAETETDPDGRYEYVRLQTVHSIKFHEENDPTENIFNFARNVRDSFSKKLENLRQGFDVLELNCDVSIIGTKTDLVGDIIKTITFGRNMSGALALPQWNQSIGTLPPMNRLYLEALTDSSHQSSDDSKFSLVIRALDLA